MNESSLQQETFDKIMKLLQLNNHYNIATK